MGNRRRDEGKENFLFFPVHGSKYVVMPGSKHLDLMNHLTGPELFMFRLGNVEMSRTTQEDRQVTSLGLLCFLGFSYHLHANQAASAAMTLNCLISQCIQSFLICPYIPCMCIHIYVCMYSYMCVHICVYIYGSHIY